MTPLLLTCFGDFQVNLAGEPLTAFPTDKVRALLVYLAVEGQAQPREALARLLWPGYSEASATNSLRQTLHRLRHGLHDAAADPPWLLITRQTVQFNPAAPLQVDVTLFTQLLAEVAAHAHDRLVTCPACLARLRQAVDLYQGDFLAGFTVADSDPFEEWRRLRQEQLHLQALDALTHLGEAAEANGDTEQALQDAHRQLALEPWLEVAHRRLMRLLARRGQQAAALAQYNRCRQVLAEELGTEPEAETTALYEQIQRGRFDKGTRGQGDRETRERETRDKETRDKRQGDKETRDKERFESPVSLSPPLPLSLSLSPVSLSPSLPLFLTPLVGRSQALAEISNKLQQPGVRLLTLVGPGGMGKTRLAVEVGRTRQADFADGVFFVPLAAIGTPAALAPAIATALGLTLQDNDPQAALLYALRQKQLLLILDNFEQLLVAQNGEQPSALDLLMALLAAAPGVQVLVTSRERLKLRVEQLYTVQALAFSPNATLAEAEAAAAVRLFVQTVQLVQSNFALSPTNLAAVLRICQLVEGMPLGLELAAANADTLPLAAIAAAIEQSGEFLAVDWHDLPERQRSMRAVFAWSWQLLTQEEQRILRQISIFRGGFDYKAVQTVTNATLPLLARLCHKSLLQLQETETGEGRYVMHELLRQFASEQFGVEVPGENNDVHQRYATYYLQWIGQWSANVPAPQRALVNAALQRDLENCRQAWSLAVQERWFEPLRVGLAGFVYLWRKTGRLREGEAMLESAIQALSAPAAKPTPHYPILAALTLELARLLATQLRHKEALTIALNTLPLVEKIADPLLLVRYLLIIADGINFSGDQRLAFPPFAQRALRIARQHNLGQWEAKALLTQVNEYGDLPQQQALLIEALQIAQTLPDLDLEISILSLLSGTLENHGVCAKALPYRQRVVALARTQDEPGNLIIALTNQAGTYRFLGCYATALTLWEQAQALAQQYKLDWLALLVNEEIANHYWASGDYAQALDHIRALRSLVADNPTMRQTLDYSYARILASCGALTEAQCIIQAYLDRLRAQVETHPPYFLCGLSLLAQIHCQAGAHAEALTLVNEIGQILADHPQISMSFVNWEIFSIYLTCYEVLRQSADPRANVFLQSGYEKLQSQAAQIEEPELRAAFLGNIIAHRKLVAAWQAASQPVAV